MPGMNGLQNHSNTFGSTINIRAFLNKFVFGGLLSLSLLVINCDKFGVEVDEPDRGTIRGTVLTNRGNPTTAYVWLTNDKYESCKSEKNPYTKNTSSSGEYIFEVPVGVYNIHGCRFVVGYGKTGAIAERGKTAIIEGPVLSTSRSNYPSCAGVCF